MSSENSTSTDKLIIVYLTQLRKLTPVRGAF